MQTDEYLVMWKDMFGGSGRSRPLSLLAAISSHADGSQASEDHRGTPESPGRVVTLIERSYWETLGDTQVEVEDRVWGAAYRIEASKVQEVQEYLDIREINGYSIQHTPFHPADASRPSMSCLVYIGLPDNPQFVAVQEVQALAEHIFQSRGPSGENREYLLMLDEALMTLSANSGDMHVHDLAGRVRALVAAESVAVGPRKAQSLEAEQAEVDPIPAEEVEEPSSQPDILYPTDKSQRTNPPHPS